MSARRDVQKSNLEKLLGTSDPEELYAKVYRLMQGSTTIVVHVDHANGDVEVVPVGKADMKASEMRDLLASVCEMLLRQERRAAQVAAPENGGQ